MSLTILTDRRPLCHMLQSDVTSGADYPCTDCGRSFRRNAAYQKHVRQVHSSDVKKQPPRRSVNVTTTPSSRHDDVNIDVATVENCCVDDEICLGENSSSNSTAVDSKLMKISKIEPAEQDETQVCHPADKVIKVEQLEDDEEGELADFRQSTITSQQNDVTQTDCDEFTVTSSATSLKQTSAALPLLNKMQDFQNVTVKDEKPEMKSVPVVAGATTGQKIFVYVKTEPQTSFNAGVDGAGQTLLSATSSKQVGCQFICPICQRLFNTEKYLNMHISSIHRVPDNGIPPSNQPDITSPQTTIQTSPGTSTSSRRSSGYHGTKTASSAMHVTLPLNVSSSQQQIPMTTLVLPTVTVGSVLTQVASNGSAGSGSSASVAVSGPTRSSTQWTCDICNKSFAQNSSYKNHIRTHSDDRPYVCSICSIGFKERYHLKKHALFKHTTELNESCRVCGKRFKDSTAVRAHERIHSDIRPYGCTLCGKTFKTSECLWHHENRSKTCGKMAVAAAAAMATGTTLIDFSGRRHSPALTTGARRQSNQSVGAGRTTQPAGQRRQRRATAPPDTTATSSSTSTVITQPLIKSISTIREVQTAVAAISGSSTVAVTNAIDSKFGALQSLPSAEAAPIIPDISNCSPIVFDADMMSAATDKKSTPLNEMIEVCEFSSTSNSGSNVSNPGSGVMLQNTPEVDSPPIDCEPLFDDVTLSSMFDNNCEQDDFWRHFDIDQMTSSYNYDIEDDDVAGDFDTASSTTETASSSSETAEDSESTSLTAIPDDSDKQLANISCQSESGNGGIQSRVSPTAMADCGTLGRRHDCARCDKRFASAATLQKHLLVHAEVRPYRCSVCDIGFKLKVHLKKHNLYRHSNDYPCECSKCHKRFKDSSAVRLHERIHSSDRPFQCLHCGKSFKTKENLWGHRNRGPCDKSNVSTAVLTTSSPAAPTTVVMETMPSNVTQQFVASNVRLFHSAEFGPILGVPVNARIIFREVAADTNDAKAASISSDSQMKTVATTHAAVRPSTSSPSASGENCIMTSSISVPATNDGMTGKSGLPRVVVVPTAAVTQQLPSNTLPTAVVAPIKRQAAGTSGDLTNTQNRPTSLLLPSTVGVATSLNSQAVVTGGQRVQMSVNREMMTADVASSTATSRKRANSASVAERCPTVQKFLAIDQDNTMSTSTSTANTHVTAVQVPASIQKLFRVVGANVGSNNNESPAAPVDAELTGNYSSGSENITTDGVVSLLSGESTASMVALTDLDGILEAGLTPGEMMIDDCNNLAVVDWINSSSVNNKLATETRQLPEGSSWNDLMTPQEITNNDDYQLILANSSSSSRRSTTDADDDDDSDKMLRDTCETLSEDFYVTTPADDRGPFDTMWCAGESSWTPDNELGELLAFGSN